MARQLGSVCVLCRREGEKLYLKGERCYSPKCSVAKRTYAPGQHGPTGSFRRKMSDYATQLREKQKARRIYGVFERQFRVYFQEASKSTGVTGAALMQFLERRFDNVIYRLGFATSRAQARQLVLHGHFAVNGKPINVPSYLLKPGDVVTVVEDSRKNAYFQSVAKDLSKRSVPGWLTLDPQNLSGTIVTLPAREQIDTQIKEQLIVEYYSR